MMLKSPPVASKRFLIQKELDKGQKRRQQWGWKVGILPIGLVKIALFDVGVKGLEEVVDGLVIGHEEGKVIPWLDLHGLYVLSAGEKLYLELHGGTWAEVMEET